VPADGSQGQAQPASVYSPPEYAAEYLANPKPSYPALARRQGLQGTVVLHVLVDETGHAGKVHLQRSSGARLLDAAALAAVRDWHFVPARRGDTALAAWVEVPVRFSLVGN
jgi:protein TonB